MLAQVLWEALSPPCPVTTAGLSRAWGSVLPGATATSETLQETRPPGYHVRAQMFHTQASPNLHLTLQSHHGLHTLAGKKQSYITANLIVDTASG